MKRSLSFGALGQEKQFEILLFGLEILQMGQTLKVGGKNKSRLCYRRLSPKIATWYTPVFLMVATGLKNGVQV